MKTLPWIFLIAVVVADVPSSVFAQSIVNLGSAASYGVFAGTSVNNTGSTIINGDLGVSPGATITGFPPGVVNGTIHTADSAAAQAQADLLVGYNMASGQTATVTGVTAFSTTTLTSGVYNAAANLSLSGTLTLDGGGQANPVFVFQMGSTLLTAVGSQVLLVNGARADLVFWQVGTSATLGDSSLFVGSVLANTSITAGTGLTVAGRLLAHNGTVTLIGDSITVPVSAVPEPAATSMLIAAAVGLIIGARALRRHSRGQTPHSKSVSL